MDKYRNRRFLGYFGGVGARILSPAVDVKIN